MTEDARDEKGMFLAAIEQGTPQEREAYVQRACAGDTELRNRVMELLEAHRESQGPLDSPPAGPGSSSTMETVTVDRERSATVPGAEMNIPRELGSVRLIREIGRGGMGVVHLGYDRMLDRDVAVKFLSNAVRGPDDPGFARFLRGTRAAAGISHPGLTTIHHADLVQHVPYVVMEYIDGPTLGELLKRSAPLSPTVTLSVLDAVAAAVGELHDRQIIHGDIKPSNVLLDAAGRVAVTDFGLTCTRSFAGQRAGGGGIAGTPAYMAPEMFEGTVSLRSDVYALGILTFELVTGRIPFTGRFEEVRDKQVHEPLPVAALRRSQIDPTLIEVIERAAHKNAVFRYKSARQFLTALRDAGAGPDVVSRGAHELRALVARTAGQPTEKTPSASPTPESSSYYEQLSTLAARKQREQATRADVPTDASPTVPRVSPAGAATGSRASALTEVRIDSLPDRRVSGLIVVFVIMGAMLLPNLGSEWAGIVALMLLVQSSYLLARRVVRTRLNHVLAKDGNLALATLSTQFLNLRRSPTGLGASLYIQELARALVSHGRMGETVRCCLEHSAAPIEPLTVPFEAKPLDEADPSFADFRSALSTTSTDGATHDFNEKDGLLNAPDIRRIRKNVALTGGWIIPLGFMPILIFVAIYAYTAGVGKASTFALPFGFFAILLAMTLFSTRGAWSSRVQWFVVPGGALVRRARFRDRKWRLHLFDPRTSVLVVHQSTRQRWHVYVVDEHRSESTVVTKNEADILLRGWLSPLEPPPIERLSDLA